MQVGATTLSSQDASIREYSSGATHPIRVGEPGSDAGGCGHRGGQPNPGRVTCRRAVGADNTVELGRTGLRPQGLLTNKLIGPYDRSRGGRAESEALITG